MNGLYPLGWGFLKTIGEHGVVHVPSVSTETKKKVRLQLYEYVPHTWLVEKQAVSMGFYNAQPPIPRVVLQYQRSARKRLDCTLNVQLHATLSDHMFTNDEGSENTSAGIIEQSLESKNDNPASNEVGILGWFEFFYMMFMVCRKYLNCLVFFVNGT